MGYKPLMSGAPTIELTHGRYEELVRAELQAVQYRSWLESIVSDSYGGDVIITPDNVSRIIKIIEGIEIDIEENIEPKGE